MNEQPEDMSQKNPQDNAKELYVKVKELATRLKNNPDDQLARAEFVQLNAYIEANEDIAGEVVKLRQSDAKITTDFEKLHNDEVLERQSSTAQTPKPEKKYVLEASYDLGKAIGNAAKGLGVYTQTSDKKYSESIKDPVVQPRSQQLGRSIIATATLTGEVVDFWSDLIEGKASQHSDFVAAYHKIISDRKIDNVTSTSHIIYIGDIITRKQYFELFKWYTAKGALRTETLGNDLYVSWRVFVKEQVSWLRVILWLIGCFLAAIVLTVGFNFQLYTAQYSYGPSNNPYVQFTLETFIKIVIGSGIYLIILGLFRRSGDPWGMFRRPLDEFDRDDAMIAGHIIHKSVLQAADTIGIDTMKLAPKETPERDRSRTSRRI